MKHTLRVPTSEQYAYIEAEFEGSMEEAVVEYHRLTRLVKPTTGLPQKEWNMFLDAYLTTGSPPQDGLALWEQMSVDQKITINEIKKTFKRINK